MLLLFYAGCMAQEEGVVSEIKNKYPYVDIVIGTHNINELPKMIINSLHKQDIDVLSNGSDIILENYHIKEILR
jgi:tRNA-2-methylthio-N6-dimethylallyladenosine synthase